MARERDRRRLPPPARWAISLVVLGALLVWLEPATIVAEVQRIHPGWLLLALLVNVNQMLISAWRWRFTAHRLGLSLPWRQALGDYYLASFANQVLPGGVLGDAWRAQRHGQRSDHRGRAWRAVIIERGSGQIAVVLLAVAVLGLSPVWRPALSNLWPGLGIALLMATLIAAVLTAVTVARRPPRALRRFLADLRRGLVSRGAWMRQLPGSLAIVFSYMLVFALSGFAIGVDLSLSMLLTLALPVLVAMLVPFTVAGWGFREAVAAAVWISMGLPASQGVAVAMAYGIVVLIASLPGLAVILFNPSAKPKVDQ